MVGQYIFCYETSNIGEITYEKFIRWSQAPAYQMIKLVVDDRKIIIDPGMLVQVLGFNNSITLKFPCPANRTCRCRGRQIVHRLGHHI
jgi:hypothetical protein